MSSENKKKKGKNSYTHHSFALKEHTSKLKRMLFYNASVRQKNKKFKEDE